MLVYFGFGSLCSSYLRYHSALRPLKHLLVVSNAWFLSEAEGQEPRVVRPKRLSTVRLHTRLGRERLWKTNGLE